MFIALIVKKPKQEVCPEEVGGIVGEFIDAETKEMDLSHRVKRTGKHDNQSSCSYWG